MPASTAAGRRARPHLRSVPQRIADTDADIRAYFEFPHRSPGYACPRPWRACTGKTYIMADIAGQSAPELSTERDVVTYGVLPGIAPIREADSCAEGRCPPCEADHPGMHGLPVHTVAVDLAGAGHSEAVLGPIEHCGHEATPPRPGPVPRRHHRRRPRPAPGTPPGYPHPLPAAARQPALPADRLRPGRQRLAHDLPDRPGDRERGTNLPHVAPARPERAASACNGSAQLTP